MRAFICTGFTNTSFTQLNCPKQLAQISKSRADNLQGRKLRKLRILEATGRPAFVRHDILSVIGEFIGADAADGRWITPVNLFEVTHYAEASFGVFSTEYILFKGWRLHADAWASMVEQHPELRILEEPAPAPRALPIALL